LFFILRFTFVNHLLPGLFFATKYSLLISFLPFLCYQILTLDFIPVVPSFPSFRTLPVVCSIGCGGSASRRVVSTRAIQPAFHTYSVVGSAGGDLDDRVRALVRELAGRLCAQLAAAAVQCVVFAVKLLVYVAAGIRCRRLRCRANKCRRQRRRRCRRRRHGRRRRRRRRRYRCVSSHEHECLAIV
jgi:hypothetical protein